MDTAAQSAAAPAAEVLRALGSSPEGLDGAEAARRLASVGPNAVRTHQAKPWPVLLSQLRSPLLLLLGLTATASFFLGERSDAVIIGAILALSVGLGFVNEYRAAKAAQALHEQIRHRTATRRDGRLAAVDVAELVPGDVVELHMGEVVPADLRLLTVESLECDESVLTGESAAVTKQVDPVGPDRPLAELASCALMGTVVRYGEATAVVVCTGARTAFGSIAVGLQQRQPETEFQVGLRKFSMLLVQVAGALTVSIFVINVLLHRPLLDALLFSLAIAVGITPQLLPAVVATSLAVGSREMARHKVLVKRLVCIEDLGDVDVLFTDKTGTLTDGRVTFMRGLGPDGQPSAGPVLLGLLCTESKAGDVASTGGSGLDVALWESAAAGHLTDDLSHYTRLGSLPFDHDRRLSSVLVQGPDGPPVLVTKGAPEAVLARCAHVPDAANVALQREFGGGSRVVAVASRQGPTADSLTQADEHDLELKGLLVFLDAPKVSAAAALQRLQRLGITVKVVTGDNALVAEKVCRDLGLDVTGTLTGDDLDRLDDAGLAAAVGTTTVFARVSPEQKARIVRAQRGHGIDVAFLGDGVNDALALHAADVGISVDSGTDVAKDAADVLLLEKDLDVLADGVTEGRRIFANTVKYVLMGTSSNFGNMFSAAGASTFLSFLPMLPGQILLNNLLYDSSQLALPYDLVDPEQLLRPARWDLAFVRRFMLVFGPVSSLFDFVTFFVMLRLFHAGPELFRSGWFVESLATQTLVVFAIRTRRTPFVRSRPGRGLLVTALGVVLVGLVLPQSPLAGPLGFAPLPWDFFLALVGMVACYLVLIEAVKTWFFARYGPPVGERVRRPRYRLRRRAARFNTTTALAATRGPVRLARDPRRTA